MTSEELRGIISKLDTFREEVVSGTISKLDKGVGTFGEEVSFLREVLILLDEIDFSLGIFPEVDKILTISEGIFFPSFSSKAKGGLFDISSDNELSSLL